MSDARQNKNVTLEAMYAHAYTAFGTAIDLATDANGPKSGKCARGFIVTAAGTGTLAIKLLDGTTKTFTNAAGLVGVVVYLDFATIETTTNVGSIIVLW